MPALTVPVYKFVAHGVVQGSQDWSTAVWASRTGGSEPTQNNVTTNSGTIGALFRTWFLTTLYAVNHAPLNLNKLTAYYYPAGSLSTSLLGIDELTPADAAGPGTGLPTQLSLVMSLKSSTPGRSGRGRMYLPYTDTTGLANNQVDSSHTVSLCDDTATLINGINSASPAEGGAWRCCVASFTKGLTYPIVTVQADSKVDTQRRREDKIGALFLTSAVIT